MRSGKAAKSNIEITTVLNTIGNLEMHKADKTPPNKKTMDKNSCLQRQSISTASVLPAGPPTTSKDRHPNHKGATIRDQTIIKRSWHLPHFDVESTREEPFIETEL